MVVVLPLVDALSKLNTVRYLYLPIEVRIEKMLLKHQLSSLEVERLVLILSRKVEHLQVEG